jgi:hypothetical protein
MLRPAIHYQVDLTGSAEKVRLSGLPDEHIHYLTGGPDQVYLSGLPDSEWLAFAEKFPVSSCITRYC